MSAPIAVLVVDDHAVVREGLRQVLTAAEGFDVVGEAATGDEALALAEARRPAVVLLDLTMPGTPGLEVVAQLRQRLPDTRILVLTMHTEGEYVAAAVRRGAHGYSLKDASPAELRDAVRAVHAGQGFFSSAVAGSLGTALRAEARAETLTPREREVLALVAAGRTSREIGARLGISPRTVESHRERLMKKLALRTVADLTRFAIQTGLAAS